MIRFKSQLNRDRRTIGATAYELAPNSGDRAEWVSPLVGRFLLKNVTNDIGQKSKPLKPPYYYLLAGLRMNPETKQYPFKYTVFTGSGLIAGIVRSSVENGADNISNIRSAFDFQVNNDLVAPGDDDYNDLVRHLLLGEKDVILAPTVV